MNPDLNLSFHRAFPVGKSSVNVCLSSIEGFFKKKKIKFNFVRNFLSLGRIRIGVSNLGWPDLNYFISFGIYSLSGKFYDFRYTGISPLDFNAFKESVSEVV